MLGTYVPASYRCLRHLINIVAVGDTKACCRRQHKAVAVAAKAASLVSRKGKRAFSLNLPRKPQTNPNQLLQSRVLT